MEKYQIVYYNNHGLPKYAIAKNSEGKYGILSGYETIDIETADFVFEMCGIICPFIYDVILNGGEKDYDPSQDGKYIDKYYLYILRIGKKEGLFSTLYGAMILKPIPTTYYSILDNATTEGLIGCVKLNTENNSFSRYSNHVFLNCEGEEVITLEKQWKILNGFQGGKAIIENKKDVASLDKQGKIKTLYHKKLSYDHIDDYDPYDLESMYRDAFENDPGAEWNID